MQLSTAAARTLTPAAAATPPNDLILHAILSVLQTLPIPCSDGGAGLPTGEPALPLPPSPLDPFASHLTATLVLDAIRSPHCQQHPLSALHFFRWAAASSHFRPTTSCYTALIDLLLSRRKFSAAENLLHAAVHRPSLRDLLGAKVITSYGDLGSIRGAVDWFQRRRTSLGRCAHVAILRALVRANRVRLARAVFDNMVQEGRIRPDVAAYTILVRGYCKVGLVADAEAVFETMPCHPNLVTYNTLIDGYCRKGMMDSAVAAMEQMLQRNHCSPDTVTFTTLISGFCRLGMLDSARRWMEEMVHRGKLQPNQYTYNSMISGLCAVGKVEEASAMMTRMRLDGIKTDLATHSCLVKGLCVAGRPAEAAEHLTEMPRMGFHLDSRAYVPVVKEYCRLGRVVDALATLDEMCSRVIKPHISLFNTLLAALAREGELDKAARLLKEMPRRGCPPNFLSFHYVIRGLCERGGEMGRVEELVSAMGKAGQRADASLYSAIVEGYCREGDAETAMGVFEVMRREGFRIKAGALEALVKGLTSAGHGRRLQKLLDEMFQTVQVDN